MKHKIKIFTAFILSAALLLSAVGCTTSSSDDKVVTDALGREVAVPSKVEKAVAIGPGGLRLYCYAGDIEKLCGIEKTEQDGILGKAYMYANPTLVELPTIGLGGPANAPDPEKLIAAAPDVIFSTYASDASGADELQQKTGIPVIALTQGDTEPFDEKLNASITLIGDIMGTEKQAKKVVDYLNACKADLNERTAAIADADKPTVYYGAQGMKGTHGIESTTGGYMLFNAINTRSVVDTAGIKGYIMLDKEKILEWDPEIIFIDLGGLSLVKEDYKANPSYYAILSAFKNKKVYAQYPFNYYDANVEVAVLDIYYFGKILYPDQFKDVDIETKAKEIFETMVGTDVYSQYVKDFGELGLLKFE